jgi:long-chain acyl-CoA synthetase
MPLKDVISPAQASTLHGLFLERAKRSPDRVAYRYFAHHAWQTLTWREMLHEIARWQAALAGLNLQAGDRVAIMLRNCPQWVMFDQAAMGLGLVVVPLYTIDRPDNIAYIINDADVKVLLFECAEQWHSLRTVREQLQGVVRFVSLHNLPDHGESRLQSMVEFLPDTAQLQSCKTCKTNKLATIIYTSGTTGKPKGVMLSHANILHNAHASLDTFLVKQDDIFLSFLPLSHTFERTLGYYLTVMTGATVAFARSIQHLSDDLKVISPTLLISVPRIYERIFASIRHKLEAGSAFKRWLFHLTVETGWARFEYQQGRGAWQPTFLLWGILQKLVAQKILGRLGGSLRVALSGGAALSPEIARVFIGLGLPIVQGYGLTETSPVIAGNRPEHNFPDSVGQAIRDVQVRLDAQGVLWTKSACTMLGYWNNPEATRAALDDDGWLNTGDIAQISSTGHIRITGRVKEIIVMSNGEKIPPNDMEHAILRDPLFEQVMIVGEARPNLIALAVLNRDVWLDFAREIGVRADMPEAFTDSRVHGKILKRIALNLRDFPGYAHVRRVLVVQEHWSIENGLMTPTLKLKRDAVLQRYAAQINKSYDK